MSTTPLWIQKVLTPEQSDSADLRWAIETAAAMWGRGDSDQALRWLHHAVHTAHGDGQSERAEELGRAVMELERIARQQPPHDITQRDLAPPAPEPSARSEDVMQSMSRKRTTPYRIAPDDITQLGPPDARLIEQSEASTPRRPEDTDPEIPSVDDPETGGRPRPPPPSTDVETTMSAVGMSRREREPIEHTMVMEIQHRHDEPPDSADLVKRRATTTQMRQIEPTRQYGSPADAPNSARKPSSSPTTEGSPHGLLESMRAVRVALESGAGKRLTIVVLADDEPAPNGAQVALLVPLPGKLRE